MSHIPRAHVGDTGTKLLKTVTDGTNPIDLSSASVKEVHFYGPGGVTLSIPASFETDGTDGQIFVLTTVGTWTVDGDWQEQVHVTLPTGDWAANVERRKVYPRIF